MPEFSTPMMMQYKDIRDQYPDCLLFYRMGDFYELFMEDAHVGAAVLGITLTSKASGKDGKVPMAGVPYHAVNSYIAKLVKAGYKVAICEQLSPPNKKGLVKRDVVRIVTPGTLLDEGSLQKKENNYIIALYKDHETLHLSVADLSTGYFAVTSHEDTDYQQFLSDILATINPSECILPDSLYNDPGFLTSLTIHRSLNIYPSALFELSPQQATEALHKQFHVATLSSFGIDESTGLLRTAATLLAYLKETQKGQIGHIKMISHIGESDCLVLDRSTMINLELFSTIREHDSKGSLLTVLDQTITAMGGRLLKQWMKKPLSDKESIEERLNAVSFFSKDSSLREMIRENFQEVTDIERLLSRLSVGLGNSRDLVNLRNALSAIFQIKKLCHPELVSGSLNDQSVSEIIEMIPPKLEGVISTISETLVDEPPISIREGGMIRDGVHSELDMLRKKISTSKSWIMEFEKNEKDETGISSLKVRFNKVFGFYIEISKSYLHLIPETYMRKQTLVNGERFITEALKEHEEIILTAEERINEIEYDIFMKTVEQILTYTSSIQLAAEGIAILDCITNFSYISEKNRYTRPKLLYSGEIRIRQGRHPVVETLLTDTPFIPNDITLDNVSQSQLLITGPNMAGKSVLIRQVALIVLMTQMGCFVPAQSAHISVADRIFVRSGASDVITSGLSTFMVEMVETAHILHHATKDSLIIMDEIGRGTSTYDGISIAWAVAEYLVTAISPSPKTLFATHYHELQALENQYPGKIKNFHMTVTEQNGKPIFLHTILAGGASHSFGVAVAKLAGVPETVIEKAYEMLQTLEYRDVTEHGKEYFSLYTQQNEISDMSSETIVDHLLHKEVANLDVANMTPIEALNKLAELKEKLKVLKNAELFTNAD